MEKAEFGEEAETQQEQRLMGTEGLKASLEGGGRGRADSLTGEEA